MGIPSDGSYGIAEGIVYSFPVRCSGAGYEIVPGLENDEFGKEKMQITEQELRQEREDIQELLG
jgi:malate dehydrogenase